MPDEKRLQGWLSRVVAVRPREARALLWSFAYFFCLLAGYYVLRPVRDEMGLASGIKNLPWLFTATFFVMLAVVPVYGALVARLPRTRFIPLVYHFFVANIVVFWVLLTQGIALGTTAQVFSAPHHPYTEALLAAQPRLEGNQEPVAPVEGETPSPLEPPVGCPFHTRCPRKVGAICETIRPPEQVTADGHRMACHIPMAELARVQEKVLA